MFVGHCDEMDFKSTCIDDQGFLWIQPIGGWDAQIATGQRVQILTKKVWCGVIGKLAIHLQTPEQRKKASEMKDLWVDIGAADGKEAVKRVDIGDPAVVDYGFGELDNDIVVGRALITDPVLG